MLVTVSKLDTMCQPLKCYLKSLRPPSPKGDLQRQNILGLAPFKGLGAQSILKRQTQFLSIKEKITTQIAPLKLG